jgi:hypothetical protein
MRVAGEIPEGKDVSASLEEFIARANATLVDVEEGWNLRPDDEAKTKAAEAEERAKAAEHLLVAERETAKRELSDASSRIVELESRLAAMTRQGSPPVETTAVIRTQVAELQARLRRAQSRADAAEERAASASVGSDVRSYEKEARPVSSRPAPRVAQRRRSAWPLVAIAFAGGVVLMFAGFKLLRGGTTGATARSGIEPAATPVHTATEPPDPVQVTASHQAEQQPGNEPRNDFANEPPQPVVQPLDIEAEGSAPAAATRNEPEVTPLPPDEGDKGIVDPFAGDSETESAARSAKRERARTAKPSRSDTVDRKNRKGRNRNDRKEKRGGIVDPFAG